MPADPEARQQRALHPDVQRGDHHQPQLDRGEGRGHREPAEQGDGPAERSPRVDQLTHPGHGRGRAHQVGLGAVGQVARHPAGRPLGLERAQPGEVEDPLAVVVQQPQRPVGHPGRLGRAGQRCQSQAHAGEPGRAQPVHHADEQQVHRAVDRVRPPTHQIEGGHSGLERGQDVGERLDGAGRVAHRHHPGVPQVGRIEPPHGEPALAVPASGQPAVRHRGQLLHCGLVDRLRQVHHPVAGPFAAAQRRAQALARPAIQRPRGQVEHGLLADGEELPPGRGQLDPVGLVDLVEDGRPAVADTHPVELGRGLPPGAGRADRPGQRDRGGAHHRVPDERVAVRAEHPVLVGQQVEVGQRVGGPRVQQPPHAVPVPVLARLAQHGRDQPAQPHDGHHQRRHPHRPDEPVAVVGGGRGLGGQQEQQPQRVAHGPRRPAGLGRLQVQPVQADHGIAEHRQFTGHENADTPAQQDRVGPGREQPRRAHQRRQRQRGHQHADQVAAAQVVAWQRHPGRDQRRPPRRAPAVAEPPAHQHRGQPGRQQQVPRPTHHAHRVRHREQPGARHRPTGGGQREVDPAEQQHQPGDDPADPPLDPVGGHQRRARCRSDPDTRPHRLASSQDRTSPTSTGSQYS